MEKLINDLKNSEFFSEETVQFSDTSLDISNFESLTQLELEELIFICDSNSAWFSIHHDCWGIRIHVELND